jgi:hypothetical protein
LSRGASNGGIVLALNALIDQALSWGAHYIARMDSDDIAMPDRLVRQISHLEAHPEVSVLGGAIKMFKSGTTLVKPVEYPTSSGLVHFGLFYNCILVHPTIVFRSSLFASNTASGPYEDHFRYAEDYALWLHLIEKGNVRLENLPNPPILRLRKHADNESKTHHDRQKAASRSALKAVLDRMIAQYDNEPWTVASATVDSILTGYERQSVTSAQEAFKVTEIIEKHLLSQSIFTNQDRTSIKNEVVKQLGALATMEMRLSPTTPPSSLYGWSRWLGRKPQDMMQLLGMSQASAALSSASQPSASSASPSTPSSTTEKLHKVTVICFSKDRAFQMQEYLRTLDSYVIQSSPSVAFDVHVIWKTSTKKFEDSYRLLESRFSQFHWIQETNFTQHLSDTVKNASPFILWGVDDVLYYNPTDLAPFIDIMTKNPEILCATLRLSPNVTYCHPSNGYSKLPNFTEVMSYQSDGPDVKGFKQEILQFNRLEATEDWNYPFELCATMMHKSVTADILLAILNTNGLDGMSHPNKLEVSGSRLFGVKSLISHAKLTSCLCVKRPVLSVITVNRVQDVCENRIYNEISLDELEAHFDAHRTLNLEYYRHKIFDAVHIGDFILSSQ